jgi:hypothetical protein
MPPKKGKKAKAKLPAKKALDGTVARLQAAAEERKTVRGLVCGVLANSKGVLVPFELEKKTTHSSTQTTHPRFPPTFHRPYHMFLPFGPLSSAPSLQQWELPCTMIG